MTHAEADPLEELLARCIDALEEGGAAGVDAILEAHPERAAELRELLASLDELDMLHDATRPAAGGRARIGEDYSLLRKIGQGGMGVVYLARQHSVERLVAIKVVHPHLAQNPRLVERFRREALALARVDDPAVVRVFDAGEADGRVYLVMNFVAGRGLDELLRSDEPVPRPRVLEWGRELARALHVAHESGVVHRDVKPSNIRITPDGRPVLLDFGLAKQLDASEFTQSGSFQGSAHYASPEQISGAHELGPASDVYSLGVTLFEAFTRRVPFDGRTSAQVMHRILHAPWPQARDAKLPPALDAVLQKACDRDPSRRYASAADLGEDLDRLLSMRPVSARAPGPWRRAALWAARNRALAITVAAALLVIVVLAGGYAVRDARAARARALEVDGMLRDAERRVAELVVDRSDLLRSLRASVEERERLMLAHHDEATWDAHLARAAGAEERLRTRAIRRAEVEALLDRAASLAPARAQDARAIRAKLYLELWELSRARGQREDERFAAAMLARIEPGEQTERRLAGVERVRLRADRAGTRAWLFRYELESELRPGGQARLVARPYPARASVGLAPGTRVLRVVRGAGELRVGDLIDRVAGHPVAESVLVMRDVGAIRRGDRVVAVDGRAVRSWIDVGSFASAPSELGGAERSFEIVGADGRREVLRSAALYRDLGVGRAQHVVEAGEIEVSAWRDGVRRELRVPKGALVRSTASPLVRAGADAIVLAGEGRDAGVSVELPRGLYVALFACEGCEDLRIPFEVPRREGAEPRVLRAAMLEAGTSLPGFVRIDDGSGAEPIWMLEREVVLGDYVAFLNDPPVLREIRAAREPMLYPRDAATLRSGGMWRRHRGRFVFDPAPASSPLTGISRADAQAYAAWLTERSQERGRGWRFRLPSYDELERAACVGAGRARRFVYGFEFQPTWFKSLHARSRLCLESSMSYAVDESAYGVYDLTGSVREWTDTVEHGSIKVFGGSWQHATPSGFLEPAYSGEGVTITSTGFRLVAERR